jgi:hypothetical protein
VDIELTPFASRCKEPGLMLSHRLDEFGTLTRILIDFLLRDPEGASIRDHASILSIRTPDLGDLG